MSSPQNLETLSVIPPTTLEKPPVSKGKANKGAAPKVAADKPSKTNSTAHHKYKGRWFKYLGFLIAVVVPTIASLCYFSIFASPQFIVQTQFAVRGTDPAPLTTLGLSAIPGVTNQDSDSYIIQNYIRSVQVVKDIKRDQGIDLRDYYTKSGIDFLYRNEPDMPYVDFEKYWQWMSRVEFSSITGNTTFEVYAFDGKDAVEVANAVMKQAEMVVNDLSKESRDQLIGSAKKEVERTENRLREARLSLQKFQNESQTLDAESLAKAESTIIAQLQAQLAELKTRRRALRSNVSSSSPSLRVVNREIRAVEAQIAQQRVNVGSGRLEGSDKVTLADISTRFVEFTLTNEFAKTAYTAAVESLEAALAEARKQQRYLATFVPPEQPEVSRHPRPLLYTAVLFLWLCFVWFVGLFLYRTVKDHTI